VRRVRRQDWNERSAGAECTSDELTVAEGHPPLLWRLPLGTVKAVRAVVKVGQKLRESGLGERRREVVVVVLLHAGDMRRWCAGRRNKLRR